MAIEYASTSIFSRSKGHSAIKAAAYRSGAKMYDDRIGQTVNYAHRQHEVVHSEILVPKGVDDKYQDRETLWNAVEESENRKDSQLAKDHVIALPKELNRKQHIEMAKQFAQEQFVNEGVAVDVNVHYHSEDNPHAHLMTTTRVIDENGLGKKATHLNPGFSGRGKVNADEQIRHQWADFQNKYFQENNIGLEVSNNNGEFSAQVHMGAANSLENDGIKTDKGEHNRLVKSEKTKALLDNPDKIIDIVSDRKSVFSKHDLYRELFKHIDDRDAYEQIKSKLDFSDTLLPLCQSGKATQFYTTQGVLETEQSIRATAEVLGREQSGHGVNRSSRERAINTYNFLSDEQKQAVNDVTNNKRLSIVVGFAGAGKSTMFKAAKEAWEDSGFKVRGVALAGKAAEGLEQSSSIKSSTIHGLLYDIKNGKNPIDKNTVVVMDEAGMVNNNLMKSVLDEVKASGAKLVLAGDSEQLQPIQAGNPFRDMSEINGFTEISTIRRQHKDWQKEATYNLSQGRSAAALKAYDDNGDIKLKETHQDAIDAVVSDYLEETHERSNMAVLAHKRVDVAVINQEIRKTLKSRGEVHSEISMETNEGKKQFGVGDRVLFLRNNKGLGVMNGSLGTVKQTNDNGQLQIKLDDGKSLGIDTNSYDNITHGYAMTIHKSQGVTVDHAKVLATGSFDKHLAYVGMSRHKESLSVYAGKDEFEDKQAMAGQFRRLNRQESINSFAKRHGIDIQEKPIRQQITEDQKSSLDNKQSDKQSLLSRLNAEPEEMAEKKTSPSVLDKLNPKEEHSLDPIDQPENKHLQKQLEKLEQQLENDQSVGSQQRKRIMQNIRKDVEIMLNNGIGVTKKMIELTKEQAIKKEHSRGDDGLDISWELEL